MVPHPAPKCFVLTLSWWSAPLKHEWSEGGLHVSGKEDGIRRRKEKFIRGSFSTFQSTELDEFTNFHRGRAETADTGGFSPRTVALITLTAKRMFWKCIFTPIFAANCLTNNSPPQTTVDIMPATQSRVFQPHLRPLQGSWLCHVVKQHFATSGSLAVLVFPSQGCSQIAAPRPGLQSAGTALLEQAWH